MKEDKLIENSRKRERQRGVRIKKERQKETMRQRKKIKRERKGKKMRQMGKEAVMGLNA